MKLNSVLKTGSKIAQTTEHDAQTNVVNWFRVQYRVYSPHLFAIPNGAILCDLSERKRKARMGYLMAEGFKKGVSDLFLAVPNDNHCGLWLEMKADGKTFSSLSPEQHQHLIDMKRAGFAAYWAPGFDTARIIINEYMLTARPLGHFKGREIYG